MSIKSFTARLLAATSFATLLGGWTFFDSTPTPPVKVPIALHQAGSLATTELVIPPNNRYRCSFNLEFLFHEEDRVERQRLLSFVGGPSHEPGTIVPVKLIIMKIDGGKEVLSHEKVYLTTKINWVGLGRLYGRMIDELLLESGKYRVRLEGLNDFPELTETPVLFTIYYIRPPKF